jgi:hypothetical protein
MRRTPPLTRIPQRKLASLAKERRILNLFLLPKRMKAS